VAAIHLATSSVCEICHLPKIAFDKCLSIFRLCVKADFSESLVVDFSLVEAFGRAYQMLPIGRENIIGNARDALGQPFEYGRSLNVSIVVRVLLCLSPSPLCRDVKTFPQHFSYVI
jgi:hypothetical protein